MPQYPLSNKNVIKKEDHEGYRELSEIVSLSRRGMIFLHICILKEVVRRDSGAEKS